MLFIPSESSEADSVWFASYYYCSIRACVKSDEKEKEHLNVHAEWKHSRTSLYDDTR